MLDQTNANIERHIKTHTERSDDDRAAVSVLETFLRCNILGVEFPRRVKQND